MPWDGESLTSGVAPFRQEENEKRSETLGIIYSTTIILPV